MRILHAVDPITNGEIEPADELDGTGGVEAAADRAARAFDTYRRTSADERARFLERIAANLAGLGPRLGDLVRAETGLSAARVSAETARTVGQLRLFAEVVRDGGWRRVRIEPALPDRAPLPRPDLRQRALPLGPVAVFGASNFPLAFSVAGGDTASALAAGCPVIVKGHPAHPGTSELVAGAVSAAVADCGLPDGTFALLQGGAHELGLALVSHPAIKAVGFTGSRSGGLALIAATQRRPEPIPVYAEMSSINPVVVLPGALAERAAGIARDFVTAVTGSAGQLCTKPGLLLVLESEQTETFVAAAAAGLADVSAATMLTAGIRDAYDSGVETVAATSGVATLAVGATDDSLPEPGVARLHVTSGATFLTQPALAEEVFGPTAVVVRVRDEAELIQIVAGLEGQLTATVHASEDDHRLAGLLLDRFELLAGRVIVNGWPTGVDVGHAMVHGGPFPATSAPASTSVGARAIERFLRPVVYQNVPVALLAPELRSDRPDEKEARA